MKKVFVLVVLAFAIACNSGNTNSSADSTSTTKTTTAKSSNVDYPYPIGYSSQFEMGDPQKSKMILDLWKDYDNNALDNSANKFADTVTMLFPGVEARASRDSVMAMAKAQRGNSTSVKSTVDAVMSVRSTDKNEDWVLVWGTEVHTDKKNATDSVHLQETWRVNPAGKIDLIMQFLRKPPSKKM